MDSPAKKASATARKTAARHRVKRVMGSILRHGASWPKPRARVDGVSALADLEVQVGPLQGAGVTHGSEERPGLDLLAHRGAHRGEVGHEGVKAVAVIHDD